MNDRNYARLATVAIACFGLSACGSTEPHVYNVSLAEAKAIMGSAVETYTFSDGETTRTVRATGWEADELRIEMQTSYADDPSSWCSVTFEAIDEQTTRIAPDCTNQFAGKDNVLVQFIESETQEFVLAAMTGGEMDGAKLKAQRTAIAMKKMPDMQKQAIQADISAKMDQLAQEHQSQQDGWGSDASVNPDAGWGEP